METDCFAWDVDLVRDLFNTRDAQLILSIPLNSSRSDDVWFWSFESSGNFSVKSMYRHLQQRKEDDLQLVGSDFWGKLWRLKVPPKQRNNSIDRQDCSLHGLVGSILNWCRLGLQSGTFTRWIEASFQSFDGDQRKIIAMTCWAIWKARNDCVWKEKNASVAAVTILASSHVLEAISSCRTDVVTPELAEAMGVREALSWLKKKGWNRVTIESDSLTVVQALRSSLPMSSYFGGVISDCKTLLEGVSDVSILFVKRSANGVAHAVARASSYVADRVFRSTDFTPDIRDVIMKEVY
uniref:RNase H type-1 domain-containing protein n=1 Tax=Cannabis sativa TaxID=3483 RepID=A0A803NUV7_CANSA